MASPRQLAAILLADLAGYWRLMQADEQRVHDRLMAHRRELVDPKIREHYGRVVKYTGDGFLAEFPSVIEAVLCAVEVQCGMHHRNVAVAPEQRMRFRIGINLGDVIAEPEDIYGDGVNIAARLEGWPSRTASASRGSCTSRYATSCRSNLSISGIARQEHRPPACTRSRSAPRLSPRCRCRSSRYQRWQPKMRRKARPALDRRAALS